MKENILRLKCDWKVVNITKETNFSYTEKEFSIFKEGKM